MITKLCVPPGRRRETDVTTDRSLAGPAIPGSDSARSRTGGPARPPGEAQPLADRLPASRINQVDGGSGSVRRLRTQRTAPPTVRPGLLRNLIPRKPTRILDLQCHCQVPEESAEIVDRQDHLPGKIASLCRGMTRIAMRSRQQ